MRKRNSLNGEIIIKATDTPSVATTDSMFKNAGTNEGAGGIISVGGYVKDWNLANAGINSSIWTVHGKCVLSASATNGTIKATVAGSEVALPYTGQSGTAVALVFTPATGYKFSSWSDGSTENPHTITLGGDTTISASGQLEAYTVAVTATNGTVTGAGGYNYGDTATLTFTPNEHYHFTQWADGNTQNPRSFTVTGNVNHSVTGVIDQHTVTLQSGDNITSCSGGGTFNYGTEITIRALANDECHFTKWFEGTEVFSTEMPHTFTVTRNITLKAVGEVNQYKVEFGATNGTVTAAKETGGSLTSGAYVPYNTSVVFTFNPNAGFVFKKWSNDILLNPMTLQIRSNTNITGIGEAATVLHFRSVADNTAVGLKLIGSNPGWSEIQYNINGGAWQDYTLATSANMIMLNNNDKLYWRAKKNSTPQSEANHIQFIVEGLNTLVGGDVTSLLNHTGSVTDLTSYGSRTFAYLFDGCSNIDLASGEGTYPAFSLNPTTLSVGCYEYMFRGCSWMTNPPSIIATTVAESCYHGMFQNALCNDLIVQIPSLIATVLAKNCYKEMFAGCLALMNPPSMVNATLAEGCYYGMFKGCEGLTTAPSLPATTLAKDCYREMFKNCESLVVVPELPATTLVEGCYISMFEGCANLGWEA